MASDPKRGRSERAAAPRDASRRRYSHVALMGDLVGSEAAPSSARLHRLFNEAVASANREAGPQVAVPLTITLGDEFQGLAPSLSDGLQVMRRLRYNLLSRGVQCRFALGLVQLTTPAPRERAWNMMGRGLADTRAKLEDKGHTNAYRFRLPDDAVAEGLLEAVGHSVTLVELDWTDRQREIALASLAQPRAAVLAQRLGMATRTFYKVRQSARMAFYESQWAAIAAALAALDEDYGLQPA